MVFLDLKKAFDTNDHEVLLAKLSLFAIQESAYDRFTSRNVSLMVCFPKPFPWVAGPSGNYPRPSSILDQYQRFA